MGIALGLGNRRYFTVTEYPISNKECPMMKCSLLYLLVNDSTKFHKKSNSKANWSFSFYIRH
jgi:hypothetical protein